MNLVTRGRKGCLSSHLSDDATCSEFCFEFFVDKMDLLDSRQTAFVFVKPHAVNPACTALLEARLGAVPTLRVDATGTVSAAEIAAGGLAVKHYGALASRAMEVRPQDLPRPTPDALDKFRAAFGFAFDAPPAGRLLNAAEYLATRPGLDPFVFEKRWRAHACVKLFPGTYAARCDGGAAGDEGKDDEQGKAEEEAQLQAGPVVINGFFPAMRAKFVDPELAPHGIKYYLVSWAEGTMDWEAFRTKFIGATNPAKADPASVRGTMFSDWAALGLSKQPFGADNGVHASASPVEAAYETRLWLGTALENTPLYAAATAAGVAAGTIKAWVSGRGADASGTPFFDLVEHQNLSACIDLMKA